jgi:hypothetical protein
MCGRCEAVKEAREGEGERKRSKGRNTEDSVAVRAKEAGEGEGERKRSKGRNTENSVAVRAMTRGKATGNRIQQGAEITAFAPAADSCLRRFTDVQRF